MTRPQHVLVPVDFSGYSLVAVRGVKDLGISIGEVTLIHVIDSDSRENGDSLNLTPDEGEIGRQLEDHFTKELERFRDDHFADVKTRRRQSVGEDMRLRRQNRRVADRHRDPRTQRPRAHRHGECGGEGRAAGALPRRRISK